MGQNNDNTEHGDLQGQQGGNLSKDPREHERLRQPEEGFARAERDESTLTPSRKPVQEEPGPGVPERRP